jgi:hypothetical protein
MRVLGGRRAQASVRVYLNDKNILVPGTDIARTPFRAYDMVLVLTSKV